MADIIWEDPPEAALEAQSLARSPYRELAQALRGKKGQWARVDKEFASNDSAKNTATNMRRGVVKGFTKGEYEAIAHEKQVWVRYIGPKEPAPDKVTRTVDPSTEADDDHQDEKPFPARVREWAKRNGREVSQHGRLPEALIAAYEEDTNDLRPGGLKVVR